MGDQQNIAYLQAVHGIAGALIVRLQTGGLWPGDLNDGITEIRKNLDRIREKNDGR